MAFCLGVQCDSALSMHNSNNLRLLCKLQSAQLLSNKLMESRLTKVKGGR